MKKPKNPRSDKKEPRSWEKPQGVATLVQAKERTFIPDLSPDYSIDIVSELARRSTIQATPSEGPSQGPYEAARARFETCNPQDRTYQLPLSYIVPHIGMLYKCFVYNISIYNIPY